MENCTYYGILESLDGLKRLDERMAEAALEDDWDLAREDKIHYAIHNENSTTEEDQATLALDQILMEHRIVNDPALKGGACN